MYYHHPPSRLRSLNLALLSRFVTYGILLMIFGAPMACNPTVLRQVPLFALLDDEETAVLASQVELRTVAARQRIYKMGDPGDRAYVLVSGSVRVTTVDEDNQEVVVDQPSQ